ncbi:hypothetical protein [uncultured Hymenobacter sp.]|uniref:hypothetical protein n=1 Tax=uncultured Hymenobacter sp. TaxID=170016 RepID=UPI0035C9D7CF
MAYQHQAAGSLLGADAPRLVVLVPAIPQPDPGLDEQPAGCRWRVEQRRAVLRRFAVPTGGRPLALDARYGQVQLTVWNKAEIRVEAELVGRAETPAGARQVLDALGVQFLDYDAHTGGGVAVASQFGPALRGGSGAGRRYEVNYRIWLPATTSLRLAAAFCEVSISGDLRGPTDLAVDYGTLRTSRLDGPQNQVRISNGDCAIAYARQASFDARFARLQLDEGRRVDLRNNYSDISIGTVEELTIHSKYGDVALGQVQRLRGESGYSRFRVEHLSQELDMDVLYSPDFEVRGFGPDFRQVTLDGGFSTIRLGFAEAPGFEFDVRTEQGQLLVDRHLVQVLSEESTARRSDVLGVYGPATARARRPARAPGKVNVKVRHGTVRFSR